MTYQQKISALEKIAFSPMFSGFYPYGAQNLHKKIEEIKNSIPKQQTLDTEARQYGSRTSDPYYYNILVGGAGAAGKGLTGLSYLPFGILSTGKNRVLYRHNEGERIANEIRFALARKMHPRVFGHSWGGATVANMAKDFPDVPFYALDPVSRFNRLEEIPKNLTIYRPFGADDGSADKYSDPITKAAVKIGGRWPKITKGEGKTIEYHGDHVGGLEGVCDRIDLENRYNGPPMTELLAGDGIDWSKIMYPAYNWLKNMKFPQKGM